MEKSNIIICLEKKEEYQKVENLVRESFLECVSSRMPGALCITSAPKCSGICTGTGFCDVS